ncbi:alcohol dehydrogenase catalytic domain-containing protein [Streptomyces sp. TRM 70351]|uniref:zinc-dependent alcohol dehydrogenase n=1 Tax=Streptomyces sp. TRM 70351 TaxID=3116552 RepID=UPI002E7AC4B8|nr:alcohol dehydrogenase catalytic domain-containing protein [Streptomyces sp. TRM 70351]MEE1928507.1 alcohol dehydrogenase catalytic domain-containing protein [Streptomyces sp. TRM 70351]
MTRTVRAVVVDKPGAHRLVSGPAALPGPGEARVAVHAAGVCASDCAVYDGSRPGGFVRYPVTPGHEWSGTVEEVGEGVARHLVGRKVVGEGFRGCLVCPRCREGATSLCERGYDETGFTRPGAFADVLTLPARLLHLLDDDADLRAAALLEPAAIVTAAVLAARPVTGERVAVVGAGTSGLLAVQLLAAYSPAALLVVEPRVRRAEHALRLGAHVALHPQDAERERGRWDVVVETAGAPGTAQDACLLARRGARVVLTGMFGTGARGIDPAVLTRGQLTVRSVSGAPPAAWAHVVRVYRAGLLDLAPLVSHEFALEEFDAAVALVADDAPESGKVLLRP